MDAYQTILLHLETLGISDLADNVELLVRRNGTTTIQPLIKVNSVRLNSNQIIIELGNGETIYCLGTMMASVSGYISWNSFSTTTEEWTELVNELRLKNKLKEFLND